MSDLRVYPYFTNYLFRKRFVAESVVFGTLTLHRHLSVPFPSGREAEVAYQVLRVDKEPSRGEVTKQLKLNNNILEA